VYLDSKFEKNEDLDYNDEEDYRQQYDELFKSLKRSRKGPIGGVNISTSI